MKPIMTAVALTLLLAAGALPAAAQPPGLAPLHEAQGEVVEGSYIVVMKPGRAAAQAADRAGVKPTHVYRHAVDGFAANLNERQLEAIRRNPNVDFVEQDQVATITAEAEPAAEGGDAGTGDIGTANQQNPPWGLDRIDQRLLPLDGWYRYNTTASNVDVYIIDTGIQLNHPQLPKVYAGYDAFGGNSNDCNGHGTSVASIAGSPQFGVAKNAYLWSVRVLNCSGSGSYSGVIAGIDWVRSHAASWPDYPAVANISFGGGGSWGLNNAVDGLSSSGVFVAVASGDSNANACNFSPGSASTPFTTNASDSGDRRVPSSNYGPCTDGYAPGANIPVAGLSGGTRTMSGTGAASPHVAGVGALYKATFGDADSSVVKQWIIDTATHGVIKDNPPDTPNLLVHKDNL